MRDLRLCYQTASPMPLELLVILIVLGTLVLVGAVIVVVRRTRALPAAPEHKPLAPGQPEAAPRVLEGPSEPRRAPRPVATADDPAAPEIGRAHV